MHSIKLDLNDTIFDKVMLFLNTIPNSEIQIKEIQNNPPMPKNSLVDFFQKSPLVEQLDLTRDIEQYDNNRVKF